MPCETRWITVERAQLPAGSVPFDGVAPRYDAEFSRTRAGQWLRETVWQQLQPFLKSGMSVLDLGCGTGEDAIWLAQMGCHVTACDSAVAMLKEVEAKAARLGLGGSIATRQIDLNASTGMAFEERFDLILSNFGALNCVQDLAAFGRDAKRWLKPGGLIAVTVMGRFCVWEFAWYLLHLKAAAWRRPIGRTVATIDGRALAVRYWGVGQIRRAFGSRFRFVGLWGIGTFLPPSYLFHLVDRRPRLFASLARWDRRFCANPLLARAADHMLIVLRLCDGAEPDKMAQ